MRVSKIWYYLLQNAEREWKCIEGEWNRKALLSYLKLIDKLVGLTENGVVHRQIRGITHSWNVPNLPPSSQSRRSNVIRITYGYPSKTLPAPPWVWHLNFRATRGSLLPRSVPERCGSPGTLAWDNSQHESLWRGVIEFSIHHLLLCY